MNRALKSTLLFAVMIAPIAIPIRAVTKVRPSAAQADPTFDAIRNRFKTLLASGGQYMVQQCVDVDTSDPALKPVLQPYLDHANAANLKLKDCTYTSEGMKGRVIMVNADADQLARWAIAACKSTQNGATTRCLTAVVNDLWCSSNAQFPVAGTVVEPASNCGQGSGSALIAFQHGVTVRIKSFKPNANGSTCVKQQLNATQLAAVLAEPPLRAASLARVSNAHRTVILASGVPEPQLIQSPIDGKIPYLETVRTAYLNAFGNDDYSFLSVWARANEADGFFKRFKNMPLGRVNCNCFYADDQSKINQFCP
ncbi:MAG TPA: hypothetical protein VF075_14830 [Pyrinomonadaceae bacterium]